jgi:hypothetical protein
MRLYSRAPLNELIPFARRVHMIETVVGWGQNLNCFRTNHGARGEVACPPAVGFNQAEDDAETR